MKIEDLEGVASMMPPNRAGAHEVSPPWPTYPSRCVAYLRTEAGDYYGVTHDCILNLEHLGAHVTATGGIRWQQ